MELAKVLEKELLEGRFWTHSKTLVEGCTKISTGCMNCWSEAMQMRFNGGTPFDGTIVEHPERCSDILPKSNHRKPRVWTYWNDIFHDCVSDDLRNTLFRKIFNSTDYHIICTKRPENAVGYFERRNRPNSRTIVLVTMENQEMVNRRWKSAVTLESIGVKVGLLIEPMLTPIALDPSWLDFMSWIICGPENGKGKRPFDGTWAMRLQAQAQAAGVPFFYKAGLLNGKRYIETP